MSGSCEACQRWQVQVSARERALRQMAQAMARSDARRGFIPQAMRDELAALKEQISEHRLLRSRHEDDHRAGVA